jgi:protein phosphatase
LIKTELNRRYSDELDWLCGLPMILDTPHYTFVHAGLTDGPLEEQPVNVALEIYDFLLTGPRFVKTVVVGHEPTVNCEPARPCNNPKYDINRRILAIDGGNVLKRSGQLNLVELPATGCEAFSFWADDNLPLGKVRQNQQENAGTLNIRWGNDAITVLEEGTEFSYCEHTATGRRLWIPNNMIRPQGEGLCATNATDYRLPVRAGDIVSVVGVWSDRYLAKRHGTVGWVMGKPIPPARALSR